MPKNTKAHTQRSKLMRVLLSLLICAGALLGWAAATIAAYLLTSSSAIAGIVGAVFAVGLLALYRYTRWQSVLKVPGISDGTSVRFLVASGIALVLSFLAGQSIAVFMMMNVPGVAEQFAKHNAQVDAAGPLLVLLFTVIAAPIGEEALMRGVIFTELRKNLGILTSVIVTSASFALLHGNVVQISASFLLSVTLCLVYEFTRRLELTIIVHMLFNTAAITVSTGFIAALANPLTISLLSIFAVLSIAWLYLEGERYRKIAEA